MVKFNCLSRESIIMAQEANTAKSISKACRKLFDQGEVQACFKQLESGSLGHAGDDQAQLQLLHAKLLLKAGLLVQARALLTSVLEQQQLEVLVKAKALYVSGKLGFFENAYSQSMKDYQSLIELLKTQQDQGSNDSKAIARTAKAYMAMGLTKSMSSNHKQAIALCDKAMPLIESLPETESEECSLRTKLLFKYYIKKAALLKRSSAFCDSKETLLSLEARVTDQMSRLDKGSPAYAQCKRALFKTVRDLARIYSLLKCVVKERQAEEKAWGLFQEIYGKVKGWSHPSDNQKFMLDYLPEATASDGAGAITMNVKMFKMVFNRALRVKSRDFKRGEAMFKHLLTDLETVLGTADTYYHASLWLELVRTANSTERNVTAMSWLEKAGSILREHYGGVESPSYIDYLLRKVELYVNLVLDYDSASKKATQGEAEKVEISLQQIKKDLAEANDAFIALARKVNDPKPPSDDTATPVESTGATETSKSNKVDLSLTSVIGHTSSEFVIESLLMKVQALAIQQPSQQKLVSAQLAAQTGMAIGQEEGEGDSDERQKELMAELETILTEMDLIQVAEYKDLVGNYYIWRAKQLVAVVEMEQGRVGDARQRMEATIQEQRAYFGNTLHSAMDQHYGQLAGIAQRQKDYARTEEALAQVVQIRLANNGDAYDGVLIPLLRIASFQRVQQHEDLVLETCKKGIEHAKLCLESDDCKESEDKQLSVVKLLIEFHEMLYHQYAVLKDINNQLDTAQSQCDLIKAFRGPRSTQYAESLYLKAKALFMHPVMPNSAAFDTIKESIQIWRNTPLTGSPRDLNHAMALLMKATILVKGMQKLRWAVKCYRKAAIIASEIEGARMNIQTLLSNITAECESVMKAYEEQSGGDLIDLDDLSEEEDQDYIADNQLKVEMLMVSNPITMANASRILSARLNSAKQTATTDSAKGGQEQKK